MGSMFYGLEIAKSALFASQKAIDVTANNIANANTVGYTRQRLSLASIESPSGGLRFASTEKGQVGGGVNILTVDQIRNKFIDTQYRAMNSKSSEWEVRAESFEYIETLFNETSDSGISTSVTQFFASLSELTKNPVNTEFRTNVLQNSMKMTELFKSFHAQFVDKQFEQNEAIKTLTKNVNDIASNIADLNSKIVLFENNGQKANELRDKRNNMLDELSSLVDISYNEDSDGRTNILLGSKYLVQGTVSDKINAEATVYNPVTDQNDLYGLTWESDGSDVEVESGQIAGYMKIRDGDSNSNIGVPYIVSSLNKLVNAIATELNDINKTGWTLPDFSSGIPSQTGINFFKVTLDGFGNPMPITAANFEVSDEILNNSNMIAASSTEILTISQAGNNNNALKLLAVRDKAGIPVIGSFDGYLKSMISEVAIEASHTNKMLEAQSVLTSNYDMQRQSVSGVSIDEEMVSLVKYQQSYAAAARVINTMDEMLDLLINRLGTFGR